MSNKKQTVMVEAEAETLPPYPGGGSWNWSGTEWVRNQAEANPAAPIPDNSTKE